MQTQKDVTSGKNVATTNMATTTTTNSSPGSQKESRVTKNTKSFPMADVYVRIPSSDFSSQGTRLKDLVCHFCGSGRTLFFGKLDWMEKNNMTHTRAYPCKICNAVYCPACAKWANIRAGGCNACLWVCKCRSCSAFASKDRRPSFMIGYPADYQRLSSRCQTQVLGYFFALEHPSS